MSSTVEQDTENMTLTELPPVMENPEGVEPDTAAKEAVAETVMSQAVAIDMRELKAILEAVLFV